VSAARPAATGIGSRLLRALRRQGPIGFVKLCLFNMRLLLTGKAARHRYIYDDAWDKAHGVDTAGMVGIDEITAPDEEKVGAVRYEPTPPDCFSYLIGEADAGPPSARTFIDVGSGKGRVLLLAALAGFRRVLGLELGMELHQAACRNIEVMRESAGIGDVTSIRADATSYAFPAEPTLCFLNNPFDAPVLDRLIDNIEASLAAAPRPFTILYYHSNHADRLLGRRDWRLVSDGTWRDPSHHFSIFRWDGDATA
jgi:hypothetical protein